MRFLRRDFTGGSFGRRIALFFTLILGICLGVLVLPFILAGDIYEYQDSYDGVHLPPVDVIVCLAGGKGRIAAAGDLWYRYWEAENRAAEGEGPSTAPRPTPILYISGTGPQLNWSSFLKRVRTGVRDVLKPEDVVLERESFNTEANALWFARYAAQKQWRRILLMTSPYHMRRAQMIFQRTLAQTGRPFQIDTLSVYQEPFDANEWRGSLHGIHVTLLEYIKWVYYRSFWRPRLHPEPGTAGASASEAVSNEE